MPADRAGTTGRARGRERALQASQLPSRPRRPRRHEAGRGPPAFRGGVRGAPAAAGRNGLDGHRRAVLELSRRKFTLAHTRNGNDCETAFYLGVADAELRDWQPTADVLIGAARCLEVNESAYQREIASIEGSGDPPARKAAKIA